MGIDGSGSDGIAFGWFMVLVFLLLGAGTYLCLTVLYNGILDVSNDRILNNQTSEQTKNAMSFNRDICMYLPVLMLIGAFIWSMARGVGGSGVTFGAFYTGWIILVLCCVTGFLMAFTGGMIIDSLTTGSTGDTLLTDAKVPIPTAWRNAQDSTMWFFVNTYFFVCYMVPVLGVAVFFKSNVRETSGSQYYRTGY